MNASTPGVRADSQKWAEQERSTSGRGSHVEQNVEFFSSLREKRPGDIPKPASFYGPPPLAVCPKQRILGIAQNLFPSHANRPSSFPGIENRHTHPRKILDIPRHH